jgi:hypothetical protein
MSIDYKQLETLVREAMFTGGGINEPSAPAGVPHRMPAAEPSDKEQDMGEEEVNEKYDIALAAREATEQLVEALDEPIYDGAYEHAFRASANLRKALNSLIEVGAHPMPKQRVVAPDPGEQMYSAGGSNAGNYTGGMGGFAMSMGDGAGGMMEAEAQDDDTLKGFGSVVTTKSQQAKGTLDRSKAIAGGDILGGVDNRERAMLTQIEKALTKIADEDDLTVYRGPLQTVLKQLLAVSSKKSQQGKTQ